ncbi:MAG: hypothetical protein IKR58_02680 [Lachnospiraceae bacterium]|nr:hypothetical protein [Lachnospiraceae bacterium]
MKPLELIHVKLDYFDGEGAGAAPAAAEGPGEQGEQLLAEAAARNGRHKKADPFENVVFGKQPEPQPDKGSDSQVAADPQGVKTSERTLDDKRKAYDELINGEYKEFYTKDTQNLINRRFKETKDLEKQVADAKPVLDMLMQRYGAKDMASLQTAIEGDSAYWQEAADDAGMSVSQFMEFQKLQRENRALLQQQEAVLNQKRVDQQLALWSREAEALKQLYPNFSLEAEAQNPDFINLLQSGTPMEHAYKVLHLDEILNNERNVTAANTEKQVMDNIRARGQRPQEAGLNSNNAITYKTDVSAMSDKEILEMARRANRGDVIQL